MTNCECGDTVCKGQKFQYEFMYADGTLLKREFHSVVEAGNFAYLEGDHLLSFRRVEDKYTYENFPIFK